MFSLIYELYPFWNYINLGVYNCAPFILMVSFNSGVIYHLIRLSRTRIIRNSRIQHRAISITLVITTSLFLIMTIPATVGFAFFVSVAYPAVLDFLDGLLYTYHALTFPLYIITFDEFRQQFFKLIKCERNARRIAPRSRTGTLPVTGNTIKTILAN